MTRCISKNQQKENLAQNFKIYLKSYGEKMERKVPEIIDFVFRVLGMEYLGRTDFVQVPPKGIQKKRFEQMARLAETAVKQESLELEVAPPSAPSTHVAVDEQTQLPLVAMPIEVKDTLGAALSEMDGDAPACPTCGHITVRNGACYKCLNCGDSLGCS